jgi:hypothetical protein
LLEQISIYPGFASYYGWFESMSTCLYMEGSECVLSSATALNTILVNTDREAVFATLGLSEMLKDCLRNIQDAIGMSVLRFPDTQELITDAGLDLSLDLNTISKINHARLIMSRYLRDVAGHLSAYGPA